MKKYSIISIAFLSLTMGSCKKYLDINKDPDSILATEVPTNLLLTNATVNTAFDGGSDFYRFSTLLAQHLSGQTTGGETQTQAWEKYNLQSADVNNQWNSFYAETLFDLETIINRSATDAPHYSGVAKLLKAFNFHWMVDAWGDIPFTNALKNTDDLFPTYDNSEAIYQQLLSLVDQAIAEISASESSISPGTNSTLYSGPWSASQVKWLKLAHSFKLRLLIRYSKADQPFLVNEITSLVNSPSSVFFESNDDNLEMAFFDETDRQNPIHQFQVIRMNYLFANAFLVDMMNLKSDPRRASYFVEFPAGSGEYKGALSGAPSSVNYSRIHTFLRGDVKSMGAPNSEGGFTEQAITYTGTAPIRLFTFAEYNFIRAEAALYGAPGDADAFFKAGIRASMESAGVESAEIDAYLAANGTLAGTDEEKLQQIIEEKYVANYGVSMEPWTDWRRTGYPGLQKVGNAIVDDIPRSLPYPQSEIDINPNNPGQKPNLSVRVFWDK